MEGGENLYSNIYRQNIVTSLQIILFLDRYLYRITSRPLYMIANGVLFLTGTFGIKIAVGRLLKVEDDVSFISWFLGLLSIFLSVHIMLLRTKR